MILFEANAKGMPIPFLKHVENDLPMLSRHRYGHMSPFHSLLMQIKIIIHNCQLIILNTFSFLPA